MVAENEFWVEDPEVVRLFPTFVWKCRLRPEVHRPINAAILNRGYLAVGAPGDSDIRRSQEGGSRRGSEDAPFPLNVRRILARQLRRVLPHS
jgi:hypothetical protein